MGVKPNNYIIFEGNWTLNCQNYTLLPLWWKSMSGILGGKTCKKYAKYTFSVFYNTKQNKKFPKTF